MREPQADDSGPRRFLRRCLPRLPQRRGRRCLFLAIYAVFCLGLVIAGERLFWWLRAGVPFSQQARIWDIYYPEIRVSGIESLRPRHDDGFFDVLLLGGSVVTKEWGHVEQRLSEKLHDALGEHFRICNLARPAHTSRDSMLKYSRLTGAQFELVILYDGINDVRMNCCAPEQFRDDYTHFAWYYGMAKRLERGETTLPPSLAEYVVLARGYQQLCCDADLADYGREIKTVGPVRSNTRQMIDTAARRGDTVLLQTFAYYLPDNYSPERVTDNSLGYSQAGNWKCPLETWGKPANVSATLDAQNAALRELAASNPAVPLVDQQQAMPGEGRLYVDVCHLSPDGSQRFVENLWPAVGRRIETWKAEHGQ